MKKFINTALVLLSCFVCMAVSSCNNATGGGSEATGGIAGSTYAKTFSPQPGMPAITQSIEFKKNGTFIFKSAQVEITKGTYKVDGDKIEATVNWVLVEDPKDPVLGKTFNIEILEGGKKINMGDMILEKV